MEGDEVDIAASMGFASFGSQINKKRKYNPHADDATDSAPARQNQKRPPGSGSNMMPLGIPKSREHSAPEQLPLACPRPTPASTAESQLEDEGGDPKYLEETPSPESNAGNHVNLSTLPDITATSATATGGEIAAATGGASSNALPQRPARNGPPPGQFSPRSFTGAVSRDLSGDLNTTAGETAPRTSLQDLRRGVRDAHGDIAYYDPSFVEDPWKALFEAKKTGDTG
ncbi:MAG: hypothetical protein M1819_000467 [Sarea resinae]|nr:MAG: hypothetical protein M1819_000467 [Sarea resinae]